MSTVVSLSLSKVLTFSALDKTNGKYRQAFFPNRVISGTIERDILNKIIDMNLYIVRDLLELEDKHRRDEWNEMSLRQLFKHLTVITRAWEIKVIGRVITDWFDQIMPVIVNTINETSIDEAFGLFKRHGDMSRINVIASIVKNSIENENYNTLVNTLMDLNRIIFPNYSIGMLLCVVSELYIVFMELEGSMEKDDLVVHILSSYLQKMLYENDGYMINLKDHCENNNIIYTDTSDIEMRAYNHAKQCKGFREMFSIFTGNKLEMTRDRAERIYNIWNAASQNSKYNVYMNVGVKTTFDMIPFILTRQLDRLERNKIHIKILIAVKLGSLAKEIKQAVVPFYKRFDDLFDHILFPNRGMSTHEHEGELINANRFELGELSIKSLLQSFLVSGVVDGTINKIISSLEN